MRCRLALVIAPAGAGKTALLRRWAGTSRWPVAWLTLEPADNVPERFMADLHAALRPIGLDRAAPESARCVETDLMHDLVELLNAMVERPEDFALVLDNYQVIEAPAIHEAVSFLLDYGPPQLHIIIASRTEPPLQVPRLRVRRELIEIGVKDLVRE